MRKMNSKIFEYLYFKFTYKQLNNKSIFIFNYH